MTHPGVAVLLQTKAQPQFDRPVTDRSKAFSPVFQLSNLTQFQPDFFVLTVRSAEGRKPFRQTRSTRTIPLHCVARC